MKPVKLSELIDALEFDSDEYGNWVDLQNGSVVRLAHSLQGHRQPVGPTEAMVSVSRRRPEGVCPGLGRGAPRSDCRRRNAKSASMNPTASLNEQRRIVAELDALQAEVDALKRLQAETAAELDALLPAVLDKAFKGKL